VHGFDDLTKPRSVSLPTYRAGGEEVATPVWFAVRDGRGYVYTGERTGKVRRLRTDPRARIAPCSLRGTVRGPSRSASARFLDGAEADAARAGFAAKYGLQWRFVMWRSGRGGGSSVFIELADEAEGDPG
jgi:PPOX class probable F420-dependent enzyme